MRLLHDGIAYASRFFISTEDDVVNALLTEVPWLNVTSARFECFMSEQDMTYTYGVGDGARTYTTVRPHEVVSTVIREINNSLEGCSFNGCFLNAYADSGQHLGWHADDSPGQDPDHPIAVISFGQPREIWFRRNGQSGVIPPKQRLLLDDGSVMMMPPGFQQTHQHRIPKGDRPMGPRVSLTLRHFI